MSWVDLKADIELLFVGDGESWSLEARLLEAEEFMRGVRRCTGPAVKLEKPKSAPLDKRVDHTLKLRRPKTLIKSHGVYFGICNLCRKRVEYREGCIRPVTHECRREPEGTYTITTRRKVQRRAVHVIVQCKIENAPCKRCGSIVEYREGCVLPVNHPCVRLGNEKKKERLLKQDRKIMLDMIFSTANGALNPPELEKLIGAFRNVVVAMSEIGLKLAKVFDGTRAQWRL